MTKLRTPKARYSNLGFELLGHALARASGLTYAEMVRRRFADPLGLTTFYVPAAPEELRPTALVGTSRFGRPRRPWTGEAIGPAGGIRAGIEDMAVLAQSLLNGSAPGLAALDPVGTFGGRRVRIGAAWVTIDLHGVGVDDDAVPFGGRNVVYAIDELDGHGSRSCTRSAFLRRQRCRPVSRARHDDSLPLTVCRWIRARGSSRDRY